LFSTAAPLVFNLKGFILENVYTAPSADLSMISDDEGTYAPRFFAVEGRIGRIRYLAYHWLTVLAFAMLMGFFGMFVAPKLGSQGSELPFVFLGLLYIPLLAAGVIFAKRRFNDLNHSGWWSLTLFVPIINFIAGIYLTFWPGTDGGNEYGPTSSKNSVLLTIGGLILPIVMIVGILAAVVNQ
jgi:uncharacterized membrane protein YhaH (DUF805 family)